MKAYAYSKAHDLKNFQIAQIELPEPTLKPDDVLVRVQAISFNPVDYKIRQSRSESENGPVIIGWDAAGVVEKIGSNVKNFQVGDEVFYAGDLTRNGSYAELQAVDNRIIAKKPKSLSFAEAASVPLTTLTAWEALFERGIEYNADTKVLIIGGAGGVGSIATQLLKALTPAKVIVTASRADTIEWCQKMGADHIIGRDIEAELNKLGIKEVDVIFSTTHTYSYLDVIPKLLRPFGDLLVIDDPETLDIKPFKSKALSVHWEFMFAKAMNNYKPESQGEILRKTAELLDAKKIIPTAKLFLRGDEEEIKQAHTMLEDGTAIGKIVMEF